MIPPHEKTLERQREVTDFFRTRGDALLSLIQQIRSDMAKQLDMIDGVISVISATDAEMGIQPQHIEQQLVSVIRSRHPERTEGLTDQEVMELVSSGGMNG